MTKHTNSSLPALASVYKQCKFLLIVIHFCSFLQIFLVFKVVLALERPFFHSVTFTHFLARRNISQLIHKNNCLKFNGWFMWCPAVRISLKWKKLKTCQEMFALEYWRVITTNWNCISHCPPISREELSLVEFGIL